MVDSPVHHCLHIAAAILEVVNMDREVLVEHALKTTVVVLLSLIALVSILKYGIPNVGPANVSSNILESRQNPFFIETVERYPMSVEVVNTSEKISLGVVAEAEIFRFGRINLGTQSRKVMTMRNPSNRAAKVRLYVFGSIANITRIGRWNMNWTEKREYVIGPHQNISIEVGVEGIYPGNYTGELVVLSRIPKLPIGGLVRWI